MKTSAFYFPIVVDQNTTRLVALQTALLAGLYLAFGRIEILAFLLIEFAGRLIFGPGYSLQVFLAKKIQSLLSIPFKPTAGPPKRFAQFVGLSFVIAIGSFHFASLPSASVVAFSLAGILAFFASLEALFSFCAACLMFSIGIRLGLVPEKVCVDCSPDRNPV